ncbi:glycosyltransferase family 4 protein [Tianweitania sp. BSSL-BM11]|uniref:Glycosyltransferase family 4 protein n=1 Tax=Tianweitania aestuarii TaxID=2814886 RepID=A0ABS5RR31_9HYPH|nr:glycosyltransferase family 4 protein [Tianweitania aestuarii]MBS9719456.1 glycosyltransferase family 4 protein [Tianweitania aestuarii]
MARILLGTATLAPGGGIAQVSRVSAQILRDAGHQVRIISYLDADAPSGNSAADGSKLRFVAAIQRAAIQADLCLYDSAGLARAHPCWLKRPSVIWMHGTEVWDALKPPALRALHRARRAIVVSQNTLSRHEALHGPLPHARICPLATETDEPAPAIDRENGPLNVLIVGRIDAAENYKGHDALIEAWPAVIAAVPDAHLVVAGGGSGVPVLRSLAAASPAAASIDIRGFVADADLAALWRDASIFAMPSRGEGFGLVYIEAMRQGLPVIASIHDGAKEVNINDETGFNVDLDRPGELAQRLITLLSDPALRRRMGEAGRQRWHAHYRPSRLRSRFLPLIEDLLQP